MPKRRPENPQNESKNTEKSPNKGESKQKTEKTVYLKIMYEILAADSQKTFITNNDIIEHAKKDPISYPIVANQIPRNMNRVFSSESTGLIGFGYVTLDRSSSKKQYSAILDDQKLIEGYLTKQSLKLVQNYNQLVNVLPKETLIDDSATIRHVEKITKFSVHKGELIKILGDLYLFAASIKSIQFEYKKFQVWKHSQKSQGEKTSCSDLLKKLEEYGFIIRIDDTYQILVGKNLLKSILDESYTAYQNAQPIHNNNNNNNNNNIMKSTFTTSTAQMTPDNSAINGSQITASEASTSQINSSQIEEDQNFSTDFINENNLYTQIEFSPPNPHNNIFSAAYLLQQQNKNQDDKPPVLKSTELFQYLPKIYKIAPKLDPNDIFNTQISAEIETGTEHEKETTNNKTKRTKKHKIENPEAETKSPKEKKHKIKTSKNEIKNEITKRERRLKDDPTLCIDPLSLPLPTKNDQRQDDSNQEQYIHPKETTSLYLPPRIRVLKFLQLNLENIYSEFHGMDKVSRASLLQMPLDSKYPLNIKIIKITEQEFVKLRAKNFKSLGDKSFKLKTGNKEINSLRGSYNKPHTSSNLEKLLIEINKILDTKTNNITDNSIEKAYLLYIKAKLCSEKGKFHDAIKLFKDAYKICCSLENNDQQHFSAHQENALLILWNLEVNINLFCDQKRADLEPSNGNRVKLKPIDDKDKDVIFPEHLAYMVQTVDDLNIVKFPQGDSLAIMLSEDFLEKDLNKTKWQNPNYEIVDKKMKKINACNATINARIIYEAFDPNSDQLDKYIDSITNVPTSTLKHKSSSYAEKTQFWKKPTFDVPSKDPLDDIVDKQLKEQKEIEEASEKTTHQDVKTTNYTELAN